MKVSESDVAGTRCIIAGLVSAKDKDAPQHIDEVEAMLTRLGATVVGRVVQRRGVSSAKKPGGVTKMNAPLRAATIIGAGKVDELAAMASDRQADTVIFVNPLKTSQESRLKEITGCRVLSLG
ncbi:hypothetical protein Pla52nx_003443 [Stieleria varia]|uniref:GTPase HflX n=2 Tax=Stieleria varia TaxID=2528005 RepID=A0A5C6AGX0_9BACT|nr:GTPase HflX [Stieleria varia]